MKSFAYMLITDTFTPLLRNLSSLLDKGAKHVASAGGDPAALIGARLAPDMFPLATQVTLACHHAKDCALLVTGQEPSAIGKDGATFEDLQAAVAATRAQLEGLRPAAFDGADERAVEASLTGGRVLKATGLQYARDWSLPHFFFHVVTAYDILRHEGVELGKRDFMGHVGKYITGP
jgi:hypothetical protein